MVKIIKKIIFILLFLNSSILSSGNIIVSPNINNPLIFKDKKIKKDFNFIVITDIHLNTLNKSVLGCEPNLQLAKKCFEKIKELNPEFVLISGDIVNGMNYEIEYPAFFEFIKNLGLITYIIPGNHDLARIMARDKKKFVSQDGKEYWKKYFGRENFTFEYGNFYFIALNSYDWEDEKRIILESRGAIREEQIKFLKEKLEDAKKKKKKIIVLAHHPVQSDNNAEPDFSEIGKEEVMKLLIKYKSEAFFFGHTHWDSLDIINNVLFIGTTTPTALPYNNSYHGFRMIEVKNNKIIKINYKDPQFTPYNQLKGEWHPTSYQEPIWSIPCF